MNTRAHLFDLSGKVALVVGGGGYLGQPVCMALAAQGAFVVVVDLRRESAEAAAQAIAADGGYASATALDIADETDIERVVESVAGEHGRLDVLVNCACLPSAKSFETAAVNDWRAALEVNLTGAFLLARAAGRIMAGHKAGSIIQFGSMYGMVSPDPRAYDSESSVNPPDYGAAKAGVLQLVRYQAVMLADKGVRVNAVVPGAFPNPTVQRTNQPFVERLTQRVPMGRVGKADEMAGAVVFLASDAASYVTGTSIVVDGGWTAW